MDIMVDMKKILSKRRENFCDSAIRHATATYLESMKNRPSRGRPISHPKKLKIIVDPAWNSYVENLDVCQELQTTLMSFSPSEFVRKNGFFKMENWCIDTIRLFNSVTLNSSSNPALFGLKDTIAELRSFALECRLIQRTFEPVAPCQQSRDFNTKQAKWFCKDCGDLTEFSRYIQDEAEWGKYDEDLRRPSKTYCETHRPLLQEDQTTNSLHKKVARSHQTFEIELARLERQSSSWKKLIAGSGCHYIDEFFRVIIEKNTLYSDDESRLRDIARKLVDNRISDNKKRIMVLYRYGKNQSEIARMLKISRQAISKSISQTKYFFELKYFVKPIT